MFTVSKNSILFRSNRYAIPPAHPTQDYVGENAWIYPVTLLI